VFGLERKQAHGGRCQHHEADRAGRPFDDFNVSRQADDAQAGKPLRP